MYTAWVDKHALLAPGLKVKGFSLRTSGKEEKRGETDEKGGF